MKENKAGLWPRARKATGKGKTPEQRHAHLRGLCRRGTMGLLGPMEGKTKRRKETKVAELSLRVLPIFLKGLLNEDDYTRRGKKKQRQSLPVHRTTTGLTTHLTRTDKHDNAS